MNSSIKINLVFLILGLTTKVMGYDCPQGWTDATHAGMGCLLFETSFTITWGEGMVFCSNEHTSAHLVEIWNAGQQDYLFMKVWEIEGMTNTKRDWWIGLTNDNANHQWKWFDSGRSASYTHWSSGGPGKGHYAFLYQGDEVTQKAKWLTTVPTDRKHPICQFKPT